MERASFEVVSDAALVGFLLALVPVAVFLASLWFEASALRQLEEIRLSVGFSPQLIMSPYTINEARQYAMGPAFCNGAFTTFLLTKHTVLSVRFCGCFRNHPKYRDILVFFRVFETYPNVPQMTRNGDPLEYGVAARSMVRAAG